MTTAVRDDKPVCQICGNEHHAQLRRAVLVRPAVADVIRRERGEFSEAGWICVDDLQRFRHDYVRSLLASERGEITNLEQQVLESLRQHEILARRPDGEDAAAVGLGQRLADRIASFGGSWTFILSFLGVLVVWMAINLSWLTRNPFDPYPFILLNLVLSCLAALQAPVIMMSQNRQEERDRRRAQHDYQVNLKAELEIRQLHQKIDHLLSHQWERLVEIQEIQMELIQEVRSRR
ncbi:MAG: DUF1003 domain-containing protein [Planctomycetota bacterium]